MESTISGNRYLLIKILSAKTGYFLGYNGKKIDYVKNPFKSVIGSLTKYEEDRIKGLVDLKEENPEISLLQEIDQGSTRTRYKSGQTNLILELCSKNYSFRENVKYSGNLLRNLPIFRKLSNSLLYTDGEVTNHYLNTGRKSLVQELTINEKHIFSVHLARFGKRFRKKQIKELNNLVTSRDNYCIIGDFNLHGGKSEREMV